jgi:hypothetical protein
LDVCPNFRYLSEPDAAIGAMPHRLAGNAPLVFCRRRFDAAMTFFVSTPMASHDSASSAEPHLAKEETPHAQSS